METLTLQSNNRNHSRRVAKLIAQSHGGGGGVLTGIWHWINGVASGFAHFIGGPVTTVLKTYWAYVKELAHVIAKIYLVYGRVIAWVYRHVYFVLLDYINRTVNRINARIARAERYLVGLIYLTTQYVLVRATRLVRAETKARVLAVRRAEARTVREIRALHGTIEREAASGYRLSTDDRLSLIARLLDFAGARNPLTARLVKDIATGVLDLASIDDPLARLFIGFLIKHLIDRLGIDKDVGTLIADLAGPLIGEPKPHDIHDVIDDLSKRLGAVEGQWAKFMENGGSQVEQAGRDWRDWTSLGFNAAFAGFTAQAVIDPDRWAREINDTVGKVGNDLAAKAGQILKGV